MSVTNLNDYRRARATPTRDVVDAITSRDLNDYASVHFICHERREVVQAGIPYRDPQGCLYVSNGLTVRFPDEMFPPCLT